MIYYNFQIFGFSNNYWELRRCRPKLKKLKKLLMENPYEGPDSQKEKDSNSSKVRLLFSLFYLEFNNYNQRHSMVTFFLKFMLYSC